jgi:hypothetical protein
MRSPTGPEFIALGVFLVIIAAFAIPSRLVRRVDPIEQPERVAMCTISSAQLDSIARFGQPKPIQELVARGLLPDDYTLDGLRASFPRYRIREVAMGYYELTFEPSEHGSAPWYTITDDGQVRVTTQPQAPERTDAPLPCPANGSSR